MPFNVSTTTLNNFDGDLLNLVFTYVTSALDQGGVFLFGVVMTILTIVVWLGWNKLRHIFG